MSKSAPVNGAGSAGSTADVSDATCQLVRSRGIVWRLAADRVIVLRARGTTPRLSVELTGPTAVVWLSLDRPRTPSELLDELTAAGSDDPATQTRRAVTELLSAGLVDRFP